MRSGYFILIILLVLVTAGDAVVPLFSAGAFFLATLGSLAYIFADKESGARAWRYAIGLAMALPLWRGFSYQARQATKTILSSNMVIYIGIAAVLLALVVFAVFLLMKKVERLGVDDVGGARERSPIRQPKKQMEHPGVRSSEHDELGLLDDESGHR